MTNNMFATYDNVDDVIKWCETLSGSERIYALTAAMVMYNTITHMALQAEAEEQKRNDMQFHSEVD